MNIEDEIDTLLASKYTPKSKVSKKKHKRLWMSIGCGLVCFMLGTLMLLPLHDDKNMVEIISNSIFPKERSIVELGEDDPIVYHYWNAPPNSFGVKSMRTLNDSFFQSYINETFYVNMTSNPTGQGVWDDANQYLETNYTYYNHNNSYKMSWILNTTGASKKAYYHIEGGLSVPILNYTDFSNVNESIFTIPIGNETLDLYFNWSDLMPLVDDGTISFNIFNNTVNGSEYFTFEINTTVKINPDTVFVIDPIFGDDTTYGMIPISSEGRGDPAEYQRSLEITPDTDCDIDNITVYLEETDTDGVDIKCCIYNDTGGGTYGVITNGETDVTTNWNGGTEWVVCSYSTKPSLNNGEDYLLCVLADNSDLATNKVVTVGFQYTGDDTTIYSNANIYDTSFAFDTSWTSSEYTQDTSSEMSIYASYTSSGNNAPIQDGEIPANTSTGIGLKPVCNVTCNDADGGDTLTVNFYDNSSGTWTHRQKNSSVSPGTSVEWNRYEGASDYNTKYWWNVTVDDGTDNVSETYHFTTEERDPTQVFYSWWLCGNTSARSPLKVFDYWWLCGNGSSRNPLKVFDYWWLCGNESNRTPTKVFDYWWLCGNVSEERSPTLIFDYWWLCGNTSSREESQVFNYWWLCGNTSSRSKVKVFDYWWLCGNTSSRSPVEVFDYWWLCGNASSRLPLQVFNYWWKCGNITEREPTQIFNYWWDCGNVSAEVRSPTKIFDYWWLCGNGSSRLPTQIFNNWWLCGNTSSRSPMQIFDYWWNCGNISSRNPTQVFNYWWLCGNVTEVRSPTQVFNYWWSCGNGSQRTETQVFNYWWLCGNRTRENVEVFDYWWRCGNDSIVLVLTNEYPSNESSILALQPTLHFTLGNADGNIGYKVYIGNSNTSANYLVDEDSGLDNGTYYFVNFYNATSFGEEYFWRVWYYDSGSNFNDTFSFTPVQTGGGGLGTNIFGIIGIVGVVGLLGLVFYRRRKSINQ